MKRSNRTFLNLLTFPALAALAGCTTPLHQRPPVTAAAKANVAAAGAATDEALLASQRSSKEIKRVRSEIGSLRGNARAIDFKSTRLLKILDE